MDTLEAIATRHSIAPAFLTEPAPSGTALMQILAAGAAAPDHGRLRPWRFLVVRGAARARLGEAFAAALLQRDPQAGEGAVAQERQRPLRAPLLVALLIEVDEAQAKIPVIEQILSAGAAGQNMLLAARALGFGAKWLTGANAYDANVVRALGGGSSTRIGGFIHLGTVDGEPPVAARADAAAHALEWRAPGDIVPLRG